MDCNAEIIASFDEIQNYLKDFSGGCVTLEKDLVTGIAIVCLKHPEKKNAMSGTMMIDLRNHIIELENWIEGKALILCGDQNFCSGGDLDFAIKSGNMKGANYMSRWMHDTLKRLEALPLISICLLSGPSIGGGAEISIFCDYLIAADDVSFGFVHGILEIIPAYGGASRLIKRLGYQKGLDLMLTARIIKANECLSIGLVEKVVSKATAFNEIFNWTSERVKHHYTVTRALKQIAFKANHESLNEALEYERRLFCPFWGSARNKEALAKRIKHL